MPNTKLKPIEVSPTHNIDVMFAGIVDALRNFCTDTESDEAKHIARLAIIQVENAKVWATEAINLG